LKLCWVDLFLSFVASFTDLSYPSHRTGRSSIPYLSAYCGCSDRRYPGVSSQDVRVRSEVECRTGETAAPSAEVRSTARCGGGVEVASEEGKEGGMASGGCGAGCPGGIEDF
jgi:hypothetical protein